MFRRVLVANRGEIAVRIIATLRRMGVESVAVFSDADADAPHVHDADVAVRLGPPAASESYLSVERVLDAARAAGAEAIHPGYGFLSEHAGFARACSQAGVVFVGPPADVVETMGDKIRAKQLAAAAGVPVVPGVHGPGLDDGRLIAAADEVGFPLLVKAAAGGGGKGMRAVDDPDALPAALAAARREALGAFGDDTLLLERLVARPRHIEVQVLADGHGALVHLGERECSLQRRHQKVVEEAPSVLLEPHRRERLGQAGLAVARACGYVNAGTVEFLVPGDDQETFYFLEMNTRLQVEHPVTELVWGVDLVEQQLRVAAGEPLRLRQAELQPAGHAVEARVYAEDPARGFLPTGGTVLSVRMACGQGQRVDSGIRVGTAVGSSYDPLLAKLVGHGPDRATALTRLDGLLAGLGLLGVTTNVSFLRALLADADVTAGRLDTGLVERRAAALTATPAPDDVFVAAAMARLLALQPAAGATDPWDPASGWRLGDAAWLPLLLRVGAGDPVPAAVSGAASHARVRVGDRCLRAGARWADGGRLALVVWSGDTRRKLVYDYAHDGDTVWLARDGGVWAVREEDPLQAALHTPRIRAAGPVVAPLPGTVAVVHVTPGQRVAAGEPLVVVEAMKMEHTVAAPTDGVVERVTVSAGDRVAMEQPLVVVRAAPA